MEREVNYLDVIESTTKQYKEKSLKDIAEIEAVEDVIKTSYKMGVIETLVKMGLIQEYGIINYDSEIFQVIRKKYGWDRVGEIVDIIKEEIQ